MNKAMKHSVGFFKDEIRNGFYVPTAVKMAWASCLDVLSEIDRICAKYDIEYFADWGTLLGAVRHGGFVPWDDDLDICMKRDDYVRFREVADAELPSHYDIHDYANHEDHWMFLARVVNNKRMNFDVAYMTEHYNFPYLAGIDIFVKDYLYEDENAEQARDKEIMNILAVAEGIIGGRMKDDALEKCLKDISSQYGTVFSNSVRSRETAIELYGVAENVMSRVKPEETSRIGQIYPFILKGNLKRMEAKSSYEKTIRIPFEDTTIPVPADFGKLLADRYRNYFVIRKVWSGHVYPFYETQKAEMERLMGAPLPSFKFDASMLERPLEETDGSLRQLSTECMDEFRMRAGEMTDALTSGDRIKLSDNASAFVQLASDLIAFIRQVKGVGRPEIEKCISAIALICNAIEESLRLFVQGKDAPADTIVKSFDEMSDAVEKYIINRREVLFVLTDPKCFEGIADAYSEECGRDDTDVFVVPLPYLLKDPLGRIMTDEDEAVSSINPETYCGFVKKEHLCEYYTYEPSLHCPDIIYITDPYDKENPLLTVPPLFYAENLRKYTGKLIYVSPVKASAFSQQDVTDICNTKHYVTSPGVVYSDEVRVFDKTIKERYVEQLVKFAGEDTSDIWKERIRVKEMSENSGERMGRKKILYCIGANEMFEYGEKVADALLDRFKTFVDASDGIEVGVTIFPADKKEWSNANSRIASKVFKTIDDAASKDNIEFVTFEGMSYEEAAAGYDAYYGSPSPFVLMFTENKKPAMLSDYSVKSDV